MTGNAFLRLPTEGMTSESDLEIDSSDLLALVPPYWSQHMTHSDVTGRGFPRFEVIISTVMSGLKYPSTGFKNVFCNSSQSREETAGSSAVCYRISILCLKNIDERRPWFILKEMEDYVTEPYKPDKTM